MRYRRIVAMFMALLVLAGALLTATAETLGFESDGAVEELEFPQSGDGAGELPNGELEIDLQDVIDLNDLAVTEPLETQGEQALDGEGDVKAPELYYARARANNTLVCVDADSADVVARLKKGEVVLVTASLGSHLKVAVNIAGAIQEGCVEAGKLVALSEKKVRNYMSKAAKASDVALYEGDLDWPLVPLKQEDLNLSQAESNSASKEYSNSTIFEVNGKMISANLVPDKGEGNCWAWAQDMYKIIWGVNFNSDFEGSSDKGYNYLRNLNDTDRKLTPEHLEEYIKECALGATIRICSCTTRCEHFDDDGLSCGHEGHSLILVAKNSDGLVTMDDHSLSQHTCYYTWEGFCNSWSRYTYIKYIKWPKAPAVPSTEMLDGISVRKCDVTYRVRSTATDGVSVLSAPSNGTILAKLKYPDRFHAERKSASEINGKTWLYGVTEQGVTGWLVENSSIIDVRESIGIYQLRFNKSKLLLGVGVTLKMPVIISPEDATNKKLRWASSNTSIVKVNGDGQVTGVGVGTAKIGVGTQDGKVKAICDVQVIRVENKKTLSKTGSNGTIKMIAGQKVQLYAKFAVSKGWKLKDVGSSNPSCVTIDMSGVVTAITEGEAVVGVRTTNGKKATLKVKVVDPFAPTKITLNKKGPVKMKKGQKIKLSVKLSPSTAVSSLTWRSDDNNVAVVDENGQVYAVGKGSCYISVRTVNGLYAKVRVRVSRK